VKCTAFQPASREYWCRWRDGTPLNRIELKGIRKLRRNLRTRPLRGESERTWFERVQAVIEANCRKPN